MSEGVDDHIPEDDSSVRFEDLTVDDDLPIIERVVRYSRSAIALQRLVHVKMLAECSELAGSLATQKVLIPSIAPLLQDAESVIRQHVAAQLLPLAVVCMIVVPTNNKNKRKVQEYIDNPEIKKEYDKNGYKIVTTVVMDYLNTLISDPELEVRRAAADAVAGLSLQIQPKDVPLVCLPIPLRLAMEKPKNSPTAAAAANANNNKPKRTEDEQRQEELRITAANLLAEMGGAASEHPSLQKSATMWVREKVLPAVLELAIDPSFRVRRCAAQAMPRLLGACTLEDAVDHILPSFYRLSQDDMHRVRKATGECLVDMSRALVIMGNADNKRKGELYEQRRNTLLPIAERLIQDQHKMVRQGMMQFLGPFMASFYPYQYSALHTLLPTTTESDGSNHIGIVAQFFPHATSMVSRLNSSQNATATAPTPVHASLEDLSPKMLSDIDKLQLALPTFIHSARMSTWSLAAVTTHRQQHPPDEDDIEAVVDTLLDYFVALAAVQTGDENTDAEMRVYCAYSFPAIVLLLGPDHWEGAVRTCFHTLLNPRYPDEPDEDDEEDEDNEPPLPVKRCLASSLHTVASILGEQIAVNDILPVVQDNFLNDSDDSVRLSTIRNFPAILKLLPPKARRAPFQVWSEIVQSDELLGIQKRSATNPTVLNWRQRDYVARSLPELTLLVDPVLVHKHIWPILRVLLLDGVNNVRDDALWTIPILLKTYTVETLASWPHIQEHAKKFSADASIEIVAWIKENILHENALQQQQQSSRSSSNNTKVVGANFSERQLYCRICAACGMALRFGEGKEKNIKDPVSVLSDKFKSFFFAERNSSATENGPYQLLSPAEMKHLKRILMDELLPPALIMKEDRISNVRITLMKGLQIMPTDVRESSLVKPVLTSLEQESETWTSFGEEEVPLIIQQQQLQAEQEARGQSTGPIDLDSVAISPDASREDVLESDDGGGNSSGSEATGVKTDVSSVVSSVVPSDDASITSKGSEKDSKKKKYKSVIFEDGSIGMQLEPTADDSGCRVCGFLDADDKPSPARIPGKINIGDIIAKVNGTKVHSYDETIELLRAGGRRKISFKPGGDNTDNDAKSLDTTGTSESKKSSSKVKKEKKASSSSSKEGHTTESHDKKIRNLKKKKRKNLKKKRKKNNNRYLVDSYLMLIILKKKKNTIIDFVYLIKYYFS